MTVKDVLKTSANMLGREDIVSYLSDGQTFGEDTLPAVGIMVSLLNLVISELSGTFIPMVKIEEKQVTDGKVYYSSLTERCLRVVSVKDLSGMDVDYGYTPEYMQLGLNKVYVEYEYAPHNYGLDEVIGYDENLVSVGTLAYGLCAEYSICKGSFDEAVMWHERYVQSVRDRKKIKNATVKKRSFV